MNWCSEKLSLSLPCFFFVVVFRLFVTPKGLKTNSGTLSNTRKIWILQEKDGFFFLFVWDLSGQMKCMPSFCIDMVFLNKSEHIWRHLLPDMLLCFVLREDQWWVATFQRTILQWQFLEFVGPQWHGGVPCNDRAWAFAFWGFNKIASVTLSLMRRAFPNVCEDQSSVVW